MNGTESGQRPTGQQDRRPLVEAGDGVVIGLLLAIVAVLFLYGGAEFWRDYAVQVDPAGELVVVPAEQVAP